MSQMNRPGTEAGICSQCGAALPVDAVDGLCPQCSQRSAREATGDTTHDYRPEAANMATLAPRTTEPRSPDFANATDGPRRFGDYEIVSEIARGGMGVVCKARQISLDRTVALKTILSGQFASDDDVQRFYTEARAAANLQHPNIVAIHEVGQHAGQHYFSMDYVEGRSLAAFVEKGPLPVPQAVRYLRSIAEAIHFAHRLGILHRDLKPSNILIDAFDQPRITDFGLAKRIGVRDVPASGGSSDAIDSGLTTAGQVLGTPSYMPPEQIDADPAQLGPASDVYSLGAILYELLTGRPPFRGRTARDTLLAVLQSPPVPIRRLNRSVPRRLERICLKCLEKDPSRRYPSAGALADDLERFTLGQETQAGADQRALTPRILLGSLLACCLFCCGGPVMLFALFRSGDFHRLEEGFTKTVDKLSTSVGSKLVLHKLAKAWRPPADGANGGLFPEHVAAYTRAARDENAVIPEFRVELPGSRAVYRSPPGQIELFVYSATPAECSKIFSRVSSSFNDEHLRVEGDGFLNYGYGFGGRTHTGMFQRSADRLLLARTTDAVDPEQFLRDYLTATSPAQLAAAGKTPASKSPDDAASDQSSSDETTNDKTAPESEPRDAVVTLTGKGFSVADLDKVASDEGPLWKEMAKALVAMALLAVAAAGMWRVFTKAGLPGWGALVPYYNLVLVMRLAGKPGWWAIWFFVPFLNIMIYTIVTLEIAKNFGKGVAYTFCLLLLPPLFYAILGLGRAEYNPTLLRLRQQAAAV
jgi:serine/threonine protein kinase